MGKIKTAADNIEDYVKIISGLTNLRSNSKLHPNSLFFRGIGDSAFDLTPSLGRKPSKKMFENRVSLENELINIAKSQFPDTFGNFDCPFALLGKLQHYGIATRLLDITSNALVALYFACSNQNDEKVGQIIVFSGRCMSRYDPYVSIISDSYNLTNGHAVSIEDYVQRVSHQAYASMLSVSYDKLDFMSHLQYPVFVEPGFISQRQQNQAGKFILFPNILADTTIVPGLVKMSKDFSNIIAIINIPGKAKQTIIRKLERFGITKEFLFPDDIDSNCKALVSKIDSRFFEEN